MKNSIRPLVILLLLFALLHELCDPSTNFVRAYIVKGRPLHSHSILTADHKQVTKVSVTTNDEDDDGSGTFKDDICVHYCYPAYTIEFDVSIPIQREFLARNEGSEHHRPYNIFHPPRRA